MVSAISECSNMANKQVKLLLHIFNHNQRNCGHANDIILSKRISISGIHNNTNYPFLHFKNIRAVGRITPENYAIQ